MAPLAASQGRAGRPLKAELQARARALGFDQIGVARPELPAGTAAHYRTYIADGRHGEMAWLARSPDRRADPRALWPEVKSILVVAMNYGQGDDPLDALRRTRNGTISVYARHRDYHDLIKGRMKQLGQWLHHRTGGNVKVFVDTAPVLEKPVAAQAGVGWQGKHTNLVSRHFGSWLLLGEIFTDLEIEPDEPARDLCGSCTACQRICPTHAFPAPYKLDARRCISYLTIEHPGHIPLEFREPMGNRIYGCDDCLAVCPWNKFASEAREARLLAREDLRSPRLESLASLEDDSFRALFSGSPIKRIGRNRFLRNVLIAIGNSGDSALANAVKARLDDTSPLVRAMAVWALSRLVPGKEVAKAAQRRRPLESDLDVLAEWQRACP